MLRFLCLIVVFLLGAATPLLAADAAHGSTSADPLELRYDTAIWAVVIFIALVLILRAKAWGPILEGLQKREDSIRLSLEEAKKTRVDMEHMRTEFQRELSEAHQQIPKLMEDARKKAEEMTQEMVAKTSAQLQADRERLRRELELAKDQALQEIWQQAAQLATLISAKAIGRALNEDDHRRLIDESLHEMQQATH
jgi:F-type H+-transporting ATPase subunit b